MRKPPFPGDRVRVDLMSRLMAAIVIGATHADGAWSVTVDVDTDDDSQFIVTVPLTRVYPGDEPEPDGVREPALV